MLQDMYIVPRFCCGISIAVVGYFIYYISRVAKKPELICAAGPFRTFVEDNVKIMKRRLWTTPWCINGTAQTILAPILRSRSSLRPQFRRTIVSLKDGGELALDWADQDCYPTSPIVIILPGLSGTSQADYIRCLITAAKTIGVRCVIFNNRGLAGVKLKTPRLYCAASHDDFAEALNFIKATHPHVSIGATGISLGGLILGNYLAHENIAASIQLKAVLFISVPWNMTQASLSLEQSYFKRLINKQITDILCKNFRKYHFSQNILFPHIDSEKVLQSKTVREFDIHFTVRHFGYRDIDAYYTTASTDKKLQLFKVPALCLQARDDPMQPATESLTKEATAAENVAVIITSRGGHIGFLEGIWPVSETNYIGTTFSQYFANVFKRVDASVLS